MPSVSDLHSRRDKGRLAPSSGSVPWAGSVVPPCHTGHLVEGRRWRLSYEDMARSHVKELVREAFELDEVVVDSDGDLPFPCGTAMFYASLT